MGVDGDGSAGVEEEPPPGVPVVDPGPQVVVAGGSSDLGVDVDFRGIVRRLGHQGVPGLLGHGLELVDAPLKVPRSLLERGIIRNVMLIEIQIYCFSVNGVRVGMNIY